MGHGRGNKEKNNMHACGSYVRAINEILMIMASSTLYEKPVPRDTHQLKIFSKTIYWFANQCASACSLSEMLLH
jgi:hypothetical protein